MLLNVILLHLCKHFHSGDILITSNPILIIRYWYIVCDRSTTYIDTPNYTEHASSSSSNNLAGICNPTQRPCRHTRRYMQPPRRYTQPARNRHAGTCNQHAGTRNQQAGACEVHVESTKKSRRMLRK